MIGLMSSGRRALHGRLLRRLLIPPSIIAAILVTAGCPETQPLPEVGSVEVIPNEVHVLAGESFLLDVRLRDTDNNIINIHGFNATWSRSSDIVTILDNYSGISALVIAQDPASAASTDVEVTATVDGVPSSPATITVVETSGASSGTEFTVPHTANARPTLLMIDAARETGGALADHTVAAVKIGLVAKLAAGSGLEIASFAEDQAMDLEIRTVPPIGAIPVANVDPARLLPLAIWRVGDVSEADVLADMDYTSYLFRRNRTGLDIDFGESTIAAVTNAADEAAIGNGCGFAGWFPFASDTHTSTPTMLNVYYVDYIVGGSRGMSCTGKPLIYIKAGGALDETLAHEIGHAMSLVLPIETDGHTGSSTGPYFNGFEPNNLMWGLVPDDVPTRRRDLSLGQVFRMNVDCRSWLNNPLPPSTAVLIRPAMEPRRCCSCDPYAATCCPKLSHDIVDGASAAGAISSTWCQSVTCPVGCTCP